MPDSKVILVTGSSRGIGAELVKQFAASGQRVVINYISSAEEAHDLYDEISGEVGEDRVLAIQADVSQRAAVKTMFDRIMTVFERVDVLINNAGLNIDRPFLELTDEQWDRVIATNLTGTFICAQEFALRFQGDIGHIVNIGASTGLRGRKNGANYCSSKAGVIVLTKCLALELAPRIQVNCVIPGYIDTEEVRTRYSLDKKENFERVVSTVPLGRLGTPADIFKTINFIVNEAEYITGQNFFVNGGNFMY